MLQIEKWIKSGLDNIEDLLLENEKDWTQYFEASSELSEKTRTITYLNATEEERAKISFEALVENFEAGLLFRRSGDEWTLVDKFAHGEKEEVPTYKMILPESRMDQVLRVGPRGFHSIEQLELPYFSKEANALLFRPCADYAFILFSEFPKVIIRYLAEEVHEFLLKAFVCK
tara:strand:+ start:10957 stop:11475 length:519 start_codon:yes stop_codon:yes gene_type:complete